MKNTQLSRKNRVEQSIFCIKKRIFRIIFVGRAGDFTILNLNNRFFSLILTLADLYFPFYRFLNILTFVLPYPVFNWAQKVMLNDAGKRLNSTNPSPHYLAIKFQTPLSSAN